MPGWVSIAVGVVAAFASTFAGVYAAASLAESERQEKEVAAFNSLFRVMSRNCDHALELIVRNPPDDNPVPIAAPTLMLASMYSNTVTLNNVDEDRMTALVRAVEEVGVAAQGYSHLATKYDQRYVMPFLLPPPPDKNAPKMFQDQYQQMVADKKKFESRKAEELREIKTRYADYKDRVADTCGIFKTIVQTQ